MEKETRINFFLLLLGFVFLVTIYPAGAGSADPSQEATTCLSCHTKSGNIFRFENDEFIDAFIDAEGFKASVHGPFACSQCHPDFGTGKHPKRSFRNKLQYQTKSAQICRRCHPESKLKKVGVHSARATGQDGSPAIICTNCHGSHSIKNVTNRTRYASEEAYCMKCHGYPLNMSFRNGGSLSLTVNRSTLQNSVHAKLSCSDCHYGFSSEKHPKRNFSNRRDYTLAASEICRRCHFDKYSKTMESIHYTMLSQGNLSAPVCIDCHGAHGVSDVSRERALTAKRCQQCHPKMYDLYAKSVHGSALFNENNQDVPVCADCHTAHTIEDTRTLNYREQIPDICSNCHANEAIAGKYGLSTSVVDSYLSDFHGVTLKFYKLQNSRLNKPAKPMAVCTDCHGTHNITSTTGPDASIVKANLEKQCRKCHTNAPPNFPDSWLSHYEPSFSRAPLVFLVNLVYRIFIPILVVGLVLQILLHVWRFVVNR